MKLSSKGERDRIVAFDVDETLCSRMTPTALFRRRGLNMDKYMKKVKCLEDVLGLGDPAFWLQFLSEIQHGKLNGLTEKELRESGRGVPLYRGVDILLGDIVKSGTAQIDLISMGLSEIIEGISRITTYVKWSKGTVYATQITNRQRLVKYLHEMPQIVTRNLKPQILLYCAAQMNGVKQGEVNLKRVLYVGDSSGDEPAFDAVQEKGGAGLLVYDKNDTARREYAEQMLADRRVDAIAPADYRRGQKAYEFVMKWVRKPLE